MVVLSANPDYSTTFLFISSAGLISIAITIFYGLKFKWFRYRMTIPSIDREQNSVMLRAHSVTEIRENCSTGVYRKSMLDDISPDNDFQSTTNASPSYDVKLKSSNRESIFRWPFRNKLSVSRQASSVESSHTISSIGESQNYIERRERNTAATEKNERLRRNILDRLNSTSSMSMPDIVSDSNVQQKSLEIQHSVEASVDQASHFNIVDEIKKAPKAAVKISVTSEKNEDEEEEAEIPPRPPTPIRRRSRSNSLRPLEDSQNTQASKPPAIIPRKKHINYNTESSNPAAEKFTQKPEDDAVQSTPKSILKTDQHPHQPKTNVHFINVPDSDSDEDELTKDVWQKINLQRDQLMKESDTDTPPPLPKTPPPTAADNPQRNFEFA